MNATISHPGNITRTSEVHADNICGIRRENRYEIRWTTTVYPIINRVKGKTPIHKKGDKLTVPECYLLKDDESTNSSGCWSRPPVVLRPLNRHDEFSQTVKTICDMKRIDFWDYV